MNFLVLSGGLTIPAPINAVPGTSSTFTGALFSNATEGAAPCPRAYDDWAALLPTLKLSTTSGYALYQGVQLYPDHIRCLTASNPYEARNFLVTLSSTAVSVNAATGALAVEGTTSLERGFLYTSSPFTGTRYDNVAQGTSRMTGTFKGVEHYYQELRRTGSGEAQVATGDTSWTLLWSGHRLALRVPPWHRTTGADNGTGSLSVSPSGVARLALTTFNLSLGVVDTVAIMGTTYPSITRLDMLGALIMELDTSCAPLYCGDFGRCVVVDGVSACQCKCGWGVGATGACTVPLGFCPSFGDLSAAVIVPGDCAECGGGGDNVGFDYDLGLEGANATFEGGAADVTRPVVSFVPVMVQVLLLAAFVAAMASAWPWMYADVGQRLQPPQPLAEGHAADGYAEVPLQAQAHAPPQPPQLLAGGHAADGDFEVPLQAHTPPQQQCGPYRAACNNGNNCSVSNATRTARPGPLAEAVVPSVDPLDVALSIPSPHGPDAPDASASRGQALASVELPASAPAAAAGAAYVFQGVSVRVARSAGAALLERATCCGRGGARGSGGGGKLILSGVSGVARAGELLGLLGPSGSGKTTLLNVLAGQVRSGGRWTVGGALSFGGVSVDAHQLSRDAAHVPQFDILMPGLTVTECLRYAAACRMGPTERPAEAHARIADVMRELDIEKIGGAVAAGGASSGISGGERKRVSIGMELVTDARLLLLDEPTSGLDSYNAMRLMQLLRRVASGDSGGDGAPRPPGHRGSRVVIASLHQPSPSLFDALDGVLLLAAGRVVFSGAPGDAPAGMAALGAPCPPGLPIAEHLLITVGDPSSQARLMDALDARGGAVAITIGGSSGDSGGDSGGGGSIGGGGGGARAPAAGSSGGGAAVWGSAAATTTASGGGLEYKRGAPATDSVTGGGVRGSGGGTARLLLLLPAADGGGGGHHGSASPSLGARASPWACLRCGQRTAGLLLWRDLTQMRRGPSLTAMHLLGALLMGLLVGFTAYQSDVQTTAGVSVRLGTLFFTLQVAAFPSLSAMDGLLLERPACTREMARGAYSPGTYMLSKLLVDGLLLRSLPSAMYTALFYWLLGLRATASAFCITLGVLAAFTSCVGALVMCLTNLLGSPGRTVIATSVLLLVFALFGGFLVNKSEIHWVLRWICYVSPTRWAWEALAANEVAPLRLSLSVEGVPGLTNYPGGLFLRSLGIDPTQLTIDIAALVGWYGGICLLAVLSMYARMGAVSRGWVTAE
ncbi:hypothetical protein FOA52_014217 [Chlamydomonas sp. UWO 241]|nr:hypothetical protein FOA52_014217 [Chlamydomonas sp. UWO 241]